MLMRHFDLLRHRPPFSSRHPGAVHAVPVPVVHTWKLRHSSLTRLRPGHTADKWDSRDPAPGKQRAGASRSCSDEGRPSTPLGAPSGEGSGDPEGLGKAPERLRPSRGPGEWGCESPAWRLSILLCLVMAQCQGQDGGLVENGEALGSHLTPEEALLPEPVRAQATREPRLVHGFSQPLPPSRALGPQGPLAWVKGTPPPASP